MMFYTHLLFGILLGLVVSSYYAVSIIPYYIMILIGSVLPDIDHTQSYVGRRVKIVSGFLQFVFKHRGFVHSIPFAFLIAFLLYSYVGKSYGVGLFVGFVSHLLIDGLTKSGVNLLQPFGTLRIAGFVQTGGFVEKIIRVFIFVLIIAFIF